MFELAIVAALTAGCYFGVVPLPIVGVVAGVLYWLPKWLFVHTLLPRIVLTHMRRERRMVALTFNDVPYGSDGASLRAILDVLDRYGAKATFFVSANRKALAQRALLVDAVRRGHQLANNGTTYSAHALCGSARIKREIDHCERFIALVYEQARVYRSGRRYYRPGCGLTVPSMFRYGHTVTLGSVYPNDPIFRWPRLNAWYIEQHLEPGDIVILHDRPWTAPTLRRLLPYMQREGYQIVTLDALLSDKVEAHKEVGSSEVVKQTSFVEWDRLTHQT